MAKRRASTAQARRTATKGSSALVPLQSPDWKGVTLYASIFASVFLAYVPALQGGLLWDDRSHVTRPDLQTLHGLW